MKSNLKVSHIWIVATVVNSKVWTSFSTTTLEENRTVSNVKRHIVHSLLSGPRSMLIVSIWILLDWNTKADRCFLFSNLRSLSVGFRLFFFSKFNLRLRNDETFLCCVDFDFLHWNSKWNCWLRFDFSSYEKSKWFTAISKRFSSSCPQPTTFEFEQVKTNGEIYHCEFLFFFKSLVLRCHSAIDSNIFWNGRTSLVNSICFFFFLRKTTNERFFLYLFSYQLQPCPDTHMVCCKGFINISGQCFSFDEIKDILPAWQSLISTFGSSLTPEQVLSLVHQIG